MSMKNRALVITTCIVALTSHLAHAESTVRSEGLDMGATERRLLLLEQLLQKQKELLEKQSLLKQQDELLKEVKHNDELSHKSIEQIAEGSKRAVEARLSAEQPSVAGKPVDAKPQDTGEKASVKKEPQAVKSEPQKQAMDGKSAEPISHKPSKEIEKSSDAKVVEHKSVETKPVEAKPVEELGADKKPSDVKTVEKKPIETNGTNAESVNTVAKAADQNTSAQAAIGENKISEFKLVPFKEIAKKEPVVWVENTVQPAGNSEKTDIKNGKEVKSGDAKIADNKQPSKTGEVAPVDKMVIDAKSAAGKAAEEKPAIEVASAPVGNTLSAFPAFPNDKMAHIDEEIVNKRHSVEADAEKIKSANPEAKGVDHKSVEQKTSEAKNHNATKPADKIPTEASVKTEQKPVAEMTSENTSPAEAKSVEEVKVVAEPSDVNASAVKPVEIPAAEAKPAAVEKPDMSAVKNEIAEEESQEVGGMFKALLALAGVVGGLAAVLFYKRRKDKEEEFIDSNLTFVAENTSFGYSQEIYQKDVDLGGNNADKTHDFGHATTWMDEKKPGTRSLFTEIEENNYEFTDFSESTFNVIGDTTFVDSGRDKDLAEDYGLGSVTTDLEDDLEAGEPQQSNLIDRPIIFESVIEDIKPTDEFCLNETDIDAGIVKVQDLDNMDENDIKIDVAKAYQDLAMKHEAETVLCDVIASGDAQQREEAKILLEKN